MIRSSVKAFNRFPTLTNEIEDRVQRALDEAAVEAAKVAKSAGAGRNATDIELVPAHGTESGYAAGIRGRWYYRFQSNGTLGNAINPKRPGHKRSHEPGTGVRPNRMYQLSRAAGRKHLIALLKRI